MGKSKILASMLVIVLLIGLVGGATMAWFTDSDDAGTTTFKAGTLDVDVSKGLTTFDTELRIDGKSILDHMNPGDIYDEIEIIIKNDGTKKLAWFGDWTFDLKNTNKTDVLLDGIYIDSMKMEFLSPDPNADWKLADQFITAGVGSGDYGDWFDTLAALGPFPVVSLRDFDDNNGMGTTPYEHMGALIPGYSYKLTVRFGFYSGADNDYQGDVASPVKIGFVVDAHQINKDALNAVNTNLGNQYDWLIDEIGKQD